MLRLPDPQGSLHHGPLPSLPQTQDGRVKPPVWTSPTTRSNQASVVMEDQDR